MLDLRIQRHMTPTPHTIGHDQPLAAAHRLMREHDIRHLPVLQAGQLCGVVSQRDLLLIEGLKDVDPEQVTVSEAMSTDVYTVGPRTSVRSVAAEMATRKYGSAIVVDGTKIIGVFTTTDALAVLHGLLDPALGTPPQAPPRRK